jgi:hypothetical protein
MREEADIDRQIQQAGGSLDGVFMDIDQIGNRVEGEK